MPNFTSVNLNAFRTNLQTQINAITTATDDDTIINIIRSAEVVGLGASLNYTNIINVVQNRITSASSSNDSEVILNAAILVGKIGNSNYDLLQTILGRVPSDFPSRLTAIEAQLTDLQSDTSRIESDTQDIQGDTGRIEADTQDIQSTLANGLGGFTSFIDNITLGTSDNSEDVTIPTVAGKEYFITLEAAPSSGTVTDTNNSVYYILLNDTTLRLLRMSNGCQLRVNLHVVYSN